MAYPSSALRIVAKKFSTNFRDTSIESFALPKELGAHQVIVKNKYLGVNASDINYTSGKYSPGTPPPLYPGFEAVGTVVAKGSAVKQHIVGDAVAITGNGCYAEYCVVNARKAIPVGTLSPQTLPLLVSGLTASLGLEKAGRLQSNETVLVTAAAGGTGLFAVQLAKLKGNHVIGTCSSDEKAKVLKEYGCDRVINYQKENLMKVLKEEYPNGLSVDVVYESVGGEFFDIAVKNLAVRGRLIIIGMISGYQDESAWKKTASAMPINSYLLSKSASVNGFFLNHYTQDFSSHMSQLVQLVNEKKIKSPVDPTPFYGLNAVADAVEYMYQRKNTGKVIVTLEDQQAKL